ncbi:MAG: DUF11 domain-containing protein, partial [Chloroflexi bacterium]|nr:DUF11 domain-containing protein [Chloroflexota bacterium]
DGDGDLDVLGAAFTANEITVWLNEPLPADLSIVKSVNTLTTVPGEPITYTLAFSNAGLGVATNVIITDSIPASVNVTGVMSDGVAITQTLPGYEWAVQDLAAGAEGIITITGQITDIIAITSTINNSVEITTTSVDSDTTNNTSNVDVTVTPTGNCYATPDDGTTVYRHSTALAVRLAVADAAAGGTVKVAGYCAGVNDDVGDKEVVDLGKNLTIRGGYTNTNWVNSYPVTQTTTLDAVQGGRVIFIGGAINVGLENLTLTGGYVATDNGGAILINPSNTVTITDSILTNNIAASGKGGAIYASGSDAQVVIESSRVISNRTTNTNTSDDSYGGGGIYLYNGAALLATNSVFSNNTSLLSEGGAIYVRGNGGNKSSAVIKNSELSGNSVTEHDYNNRGNGGGIYVDRGTLLVAGSIISNNLSGRQGGAFYITGDGSNGTSATITNTAVISNNAGLREGGGFRATGRAFVTVVNSTFSGNNSDEEGGAISVSGNNTVVLITNTTIFNNTSGNGAADAAVDVGASGTLELKNTIIASNTRTTSGTLDNCANSATFTSNGYNLSNDPCDNLLTATGDLINTNPLLGPLQDNGGNTPTHALLSGSPAINTGNCDLSTDQRGETRPGTFTTFCDIGAYEAQGVQADVSLSKAVTPTTASPGDIITYTLAFSNSGSYTATGVIITDSVPVSVSVTSIMSDGVAITQTSPGYVWAVQDLAPSEGGVITITGQITDSIYITSTINNSVEITTTSVDSDTNNNTSNVDVTVSPTGNCYATPDNGSTVYQHSTALAVRLAVADAAAGGTVKVAGYCAGVNDDAGDKEVVGLDKNLTIIGAYTNTDWSTSQPGLYTTTLDAVQGGRVIEIIGGVNVWLESLTLTGGQSGSDGGGIHNSTGAQVVLTNTIVSNNTALAGTGRGGGIYNANGGSIVTLINSTVSSNTADFGGGISNRNGGSVAMTNTIVSSNTALTGNGRGGGIFNRDGGSIVTFISTTLSRNTAQEGGGIYNTRSGSVVMTNSPVSSNTASTNGGGIYNTDNGSVVNIINTTISSNTALGAGIDGGGGIYNATDSSVVMTNTTISSNTASFGYGGGIYNYYSSMVMTNTTVSSNTAPSGGGILNYNSSVTMTNSAVSRNTGTSGGGIYNLFAGSVDMTNSAVSNNTTSSDGGGIFNIAGGSVDMSNSTVYSNTALAGGGIYNSDIGSVVNMSNTVVSSNTVSSGGGGIYNTSSGAINMNYTTISSNTTTSIGGGGIFNTVGGFIKMSNSTLVYNSSNNGGGVYNMSGGQVSIINSTLSHNEAASWGGGIIMDTNTSIITLTHTTVSNNTAFNGAGLYVAFNSTFRVRNSIVANNSPGLNCDTVFGGSISSSGYNLSSDGSCDFDSIGDQQNSDPLLGPLADNGGPAAGVDGEHPMLTHALPSNSPALEGAVCVSGITTDQRGSGFSRPDPSPFCDIGAYEANEVVVRDVSISKTVNPGTAQPGDTITYTITFSNAGIGLADGVVITDNIPVSVTNVTVISSGVPITDTAYSPAYVWEVQDLAVNQTSIITVTAQISSPLAAGIFTNTAEITTTSADGNSDNNSYSAGVTVIMPDLSIAKSVNPGAAQAGDTITYTLTFSNTGTGTATGVVITDSIPISVNYGSLNIVNPSGLTITPTNGFTYAWTVEDLSPGEGGTITITGQITDSIAITSTINNSVEITTTSVDSDTTNNTSNVDVTVTPVGNCYATPDDGTTVYQHSTALAVRLAVADAAAGGMVKVAGYCVGVGGDTHNGYQQVIDLNKDLTLRGGYTFTNWTTSDPTNNPTILDAEASGRVVNIDSSASVTIENLSLTNGATTSQAGAGVYVFGDSTSAVISNSHVYSNTATGDSGGIYNKYGQVWLINSEVYNSNGSRGAALGNENDSSGATQTAQLTVQNSRIYNNQASSHGGAIWNRYNGQVIISDSHFYNNRSDGNGGGLYITGSSSYLTMTDTLVYSNSSADGGGIYLASGSANLERSDIFSNTTTTGDGGGIYNKGQFTISSGQLYSNTTGSNGGGLYSSGGTIAMTDTTIYSNTASSGGGLYNSGGSTMSINNGSIYENRATGYGGGLYNYGTSSQMTITGSHIYSNTATDAGGIHNYQGQVWLTNSDVYSNIATNKWGGDGRGGGIGIEQGTAVLTIDNSRIHDNQSAGIGGGIWLRYSSKILISDSEIHNNTSTGNRGGGLFLSGGSFTSTISITDTLIYSNTAFTNGGGLYINQKADVMLTGMQILSNTAGTNGGAFYVNQDTVNMTVTNSCIVFNSDTAAENNTTNDISATGNWWGAENGPSGQGPGGGDSVSNNVDYSGFLTAAPTGCPTYPKVDMEVTKTVNPTSATAGETITYTISFTNNGPGTATNVVITDTIPVSLTHSSLSYTYTGALITATSNISYAWNVKDLSVGEWGVITITGNVSSSLSGDTTFTNTAIIASITLDSNLANNIDQASLDVVVPRVQFSSTTYNVDEDSGPASITVTLDAANPYADVTVVYTTSNGTALAGQDYTAVANTLTIPAGSASETFDVPITVDTLDETDETVNLSLSSPGGASLGNPTAATLTINDDDDPPTLSINDVLVNETGSTATFTVTLSTASSFDVDVDYATYDGTAQASGDYTAIATQTMNLAAGDTTGNVIVTINDDVADEGLESFYVRLGNPVNATIGDGEGEGTIIDNEGPPILTINNVTVNEGAGNATFTVTLSNESAFDVGVDYVSSDGTAVAGEDYTAASGRLTVTAGITTGNVILPILQDSLDENSETYTVTLSNPANATIADDEGIGTITDDDPQPTLSIGDETVNEGVGTATFTVTLSTASGLDVGVNYVTGDGTALAGQDYTAVVAGALTIPAGDTTGNVDVTITDDTLDENNETFTITLSLPTNATILDDEAIGTITDNDDPPTLS